MDISLNRGPKLSWTVADLGPTPRLSPSSKRTVRVLIVLALYGAAVFSIERLASDVRSHPLATSSDIGLCHRP
jgi:hypothetical protein